jgi:NAD(P)-dependent dehydrogenase (short-subunit alcohol dehydrogenase family)
MDQPARSKKGKVALVTGAARGLGLAFAQRLAAEGASVVAVDRLEAVGLVEKLKRLGATAAGSFQIDVSDEEQVAGLAEVVLARYGRCDIIINNAGVVPLAPLSEITFAEWRSVMAINVDSMFLLCRALVPSMVECRYGRIVNITSAMLGMMATGRCHYLASKGAIVGFTRALANDVGPSGVTVNCLAPGLTRTPFTEEVLAGTNYFELSANQRAIKKEQVPEDLVGAMSFLTSDDAAFMTGQTLIVDGGLVKSM